MEMQQTVFIQRGDQSAIGQWFLLIFELTWAKACNKEVCLNHFYVCTYQLLAGTTAEPPPDMRLK